MKPQPDPTRRTTITKITLNAFIFSLLAPLAVACGDAGDTQFDEDPGFGEELVGEEGDNNGDLHDDEPNPDDEESLEHAGRPR